MDGLARRDRDGGSSGRSPYRDDPLSCAAPDLRLLINAVEAEVIPRLLSTRSRRAPSDLQPTRTDVELICAMAIDREIGRAHGHIALLADRGVSIEAIYLHLLAPAANLLGEMWEQDRISFFDVSIGLCSLHQILFRLSLDDGAETAREARRGAALFAPAPGETHVFGTLIIARMFVRAGWQCWTELSASSEQIVALVEETGVNLVGLSLSCDRFAPALRDTVSALRTTSGPAPLVMVGGPAIQRDPELWRAIGADLTAPDPQSAIIRAEAQLDRRIAHG